MYKIKLLLAKSVTKINDRTEIGIIKSSMIPDVGKTIVYKGEAYKTISLYYEVDDNDELILSLIVHKITK